MGLQWDKPLIFHLNGSSDTLSIRYQDDGGNLIDVTASSPWSTNFNLGSSERPFLAFIRVDNNGLPGQDVTVYIRLDDSTKKSGPAVAGGGALELYTIID